MGCDYSRSIPQTILSLVNSIFLFLSLLFILFGSIFILAPHQVIYLINYISNQQKSQFVGVLVSVSGPLVLEQFGQCLACMSVLLLPLSLAGYIGALRINSTLLILYYIPMLVLWSIQLVVVTCLPLLKSRLHGLVAWGAHLSLGSYRGESVEENLSTVSWNYIMASFSCCGLNNYTDFKQSQTFIQTKLKNQIVPDACCALATELYPSTISASDPNCIYTPTTYNSYFIQGCESVVGGFLMQHIDKIIIAGIAFLASQIILVILAVCLCLLKPEKQVQTLILDKHGQRNVEKI